MAKDNTKEDSSPFYRKSSAHTPKYAEVQGEEQPIECIKYKWPGGGGGGVGIPIIHNVMGQEDYLREENGVRIDNSGTVRVIFTTEFPAYGRVKYGLADEAQSLISGTPEMSLVQDTGYNLVLTKYHEIFFPISAVDALFAFQVWGKNEDGDEEKSGIYYFRTGSEVVFQPGGVFTAYVLDPFSSFDSLEVDFSSQWTAVVETGSEESIGNLSLVVLSSAKVTLGAEHNQDLITIEADTEVSSPF